MARYGHTPNKVNKDTKRQSLNTTIYDKVPESNDDIYLIAQEGDRLDNLAFQFYGNQHLWWYIAHANNLTTMNIEAGKQLRIPASTQHTDTK